MTKLCTPWHFWTFKESQLQHFQDTRNGSENMSRQVPADHSEKWRLWANGMWPTCPSEFCPSRRLRTCFQLVTSSPLSTSQRTLDAKESRTLGVRSAELPVFWWTPSGLLWSNIFRLKKFLDHPCFKCLILLPLPQVSMPLVACCAANQSLPLSYSLKSLKSETSKKSYFIHFPNHFLIWKHLMISNHVTWKVCRVHFFELSFQGRIASATWIFSHLGVAGDGIGFLIATGHCQSPAILAGPVTMGSTLCSGDARVNLKYQSSLGLKIFLADWSM